MTVQDLKQLLVKNERLQLVDVRSPGEFASGHVPGAVNIPMEEVEARLADLRLDEPIVWVCQSGTRAEMTCSQMQHRTSNSLRLDGGTSAWEAAGEPVVRSSASRWALERQVRLGAGILVLTGTLLGVFVNASWVWLAVFVGAGLTFASLTGLCLMGSLLAAMPWNKPQPAPSEGR